MANTFAFRQNPGRGLQAMDLYRKSKRPGSEQIANQFFETFQRGIQTAVLRRWDGSNWVLVGRPKIYVNGQWFIKPMKVRDTNKPAWTYLGF